MPEEQKDRMLPGKHRVTNVSKGTRFFHHAGGMTELKPGQSADNIELMESHVRSIAQRGEGEFIVHNGDRVLFPDPAEQERRAEERRSATGAMGTNANLSLDPLDQMSDDELRSIIKERDGEAPSARTSRANLLKAAKRE